MSLHTIPFQVGPLHYSLVVILDEETLQRIRNYDPAEIRTQALTRVLGEPWSYLTLKDVVLAYATAEELLTVKTLCNEGKMREALRLVTRNYAFRPPEGDGAPPGLQL